VGAGVKYHACREQGKWEHGAFTPREGAWLPCRGSQFWRKFKIAVCAPELVTLGSTPPPPPCCFQTFFRFKILAIFREKHNISQLGPQGAAVGRGGG